MGKYSITNRRTRTKQSVVSKREAAIQAEEKRKAYLAERFAKRLSVRSDEDEQS